MVTAAFALAAARIALAIVLDAGALIIWDIGTRSPGRLIADMRNGLQQKSAIARGLLRFLVGALALAAGATIGASVAGGSADFTILESWTLVTALTLEGLIGPDVRARVR